MKITFRSLILSFAVLLLTVLSVHAQSGELETGFSLDGKLDAIAGNTDEYGRKVGVQPATGNLVVAGHVLNTTQAHDLAVRRYLPNGNLDTTFGIGGIAIVDFFGDDKLTDFHVYPDGKMLLAGYTDVSGGGDFDFALARLNENGSLDTSFNSSGKQTIDIAGQDDKAYSITVISTGQILVAGSARVDKGILGNDLDFAIIRLNLDGNLDFTFNTTGKVTADFTQDHEAAFGVDVQIDPLGVNDKIVAAGVDYVLNPSINSSIRLIRLNSDGSEDTSFGTVGRASMEIGTVGASVSTMMMLPDNNILVAGKAYNDVLIEDLDEPGVAPNLLDPTYTDDMMLARFYSDGSVDKTFGGLKTGYTLVDVGSLDNPVTASVADEISDLTFQIDGKIVVSGSTFYANNWDFVVARYYSNGLFEGASRVDFSAGDDKA